MEDISQVIAAHIQRVEQKLLIARAEVGALESQLEKARKAYAEAGNDTPPNEVVFIPDAPSVNASRKSIKALALESLQTHFPDGATAIDMLDHFAKAYGRTDIPRTTLSPQLTILKNEGKIAREGHIWRAIVDA